MNRYCLSAAAVALTALLGVSRAAAEPGRYDGLNALVSALPETNPNADPDYMTNLGYNFPDQLAGCHWKTDEMAAIERILDLFKKHTSASGDVDKKALIADLGNLPDFANRDKDPKAKSDFNSLKLGIHMAPDMTKASLVNADCRTMLQMNFDNGASRDDLNKVLLQNRFKLDAQRAPR